MRIWYCPARVMYRTHLLVTYCSFRGSTFKLRTCKPDDVNMGT